MYTQALWNVAQGQGLALTIPPIGPHRFAIHVEPILFLLVPYFPILTDDPRSILWLQAIVMALGGLPLYGLARRRLSSEWAALGIVLAYFLLPAVESITLFDFHAVGLEPALMLAALYFLDRALLVPSDRRGIWSDHKLKSTEGESSAPGPGTETTRQGSCIRNPDVWLSALFFLLALSTKEDISLTVLVLGLYLLIFRRHWKSGLVLSLVGLVWFYVAAYLIIPAYRPDGSGSAYLGFFNDLGDTPVEILFSPIRSPGKVLALVAAPDTIRGILMLTLPLAFVPFIGWRLLLPAAPVLAIPLLSSNPLMHDLETYHYAAPAIPFIMVATVDGVGRLAGFLRSRIRRPEDQRPQRIPLELWVVVVILLFSISYHYFRGYSPLARPFHWPAVTAHHQIGDALAASIPEGAPVIAQAELVPLVAHRPFVKIWQGPFDPNADYFLLDVAHPAFVNRFGAQESLMSDIAADPTVGITVSEDGYLLLEKGAPRLPITAEFFSFIYASPPAGAAPVDATFGDSLQLIAYQTERNYAEREEEPLLTLYWQVLASPSDDYLISIFLLDENDIPVGATLYQQPVTNWWPTSRWGQGETVRLLANTFPWWTGDRKEFGYGIAVVQGDDPWDVSKRLPVNRSDGGVDPIDEGTILPLVRFRRIANIPYPR